MQVELMPMARVFFQKRDRAKYISHLDTMRTLTRALKRSGLPLWYTQGFNPHLYMTFALPIALGYESLCESFDIRLTEEIAESEISHRINAALPPGFRVVGTAAPVMKPSEIAWADYKVQLYYRQGGEDIAAGLREFAEKPEIPVMKRTKKGEKEIDIRPHTQLANTASDSGEVSLELRMAAGNEINIAPTLFLSAFYKAGGAQPQRTRIIRTAMRNQQLELFR